MSTNIGFAILKTTVASVAFAVAAVSSSLADAAHITPKAAFANSKYEDERGPEYAINGTGMDETTGAHGVDAKGYMWMGKGSGNVNNASFAKWFVVDLGKVYSLDKMKIWNFNMNNGQSYANRGLKQIDIYVSTKDEDFSGSPTFSDTSTWTLFKENHSVSKATGAADYKGDTPVEFNGTAARWVGFWIDSLHDNSLESGHTGGYGGLSEVRFWKASGAAVSVVGSPTVSSATEASLSGTVQNTEGNNCDVRLVYGMAAEGDDPSNWTGATTWVSRGDGEFSVNLTGLSADTEYQAAFALKRSESDIVYSEKTTFSTAVVGIQVPGDFYESSKSEKSIVFSRPAGASTQALVVSYSLGGTAVSGTDYAELSGSVEFAAGVATTNVVISPIDNDRTDGARTVVVTVLPGRYVAGATGTFSILDDEGDAADCVWTGNGDGTSWDNPANWSGQAVPREIDTAIFRSAANVTLSSAQTIRKLVLDNPGALNVSAVADSGATLALAGLERTTSDDSVQTFSLPVLAYAVGDGTNYWSVAGGGDLRLGGGLSAVAVCPVLKTGAGKVTLAGPLTAAKPLLWVKEGTLSAAAENCLKGSTWVGGGTEPAKLDFTRDDVIAGNQQSTLTVLTNGTANIRLTNWEHCYQYFVARDGGVINCANASFVLKATLRGGEIICGTNNRIQAAGYWGQGIETEASALTAYYRAGMLLNHYDAPNPAYISIADGEAPVDFVMTGSFSWTDAASSKSIEKRWSGVMKMTASTGASSSAPFRLSAGTLLCDNESGSPIGNTELRVATGATVGGRGFIGGTERGNVTTVGGSSTAFASVVPGSIDEETGAHLYGTLTVGTESTTNAVTLGAWTHLKIGVGPKNSETKLSDVDKLKVCGDLTIGEDCALDLTTNSAKLEDIKGGTFTIVEADAITGTFAEVLKPKNTWKVEYVSEEVGEGEEKETVVKRIVLTVPVKGFMISVR